MSAYVVAIVGASGTGKTWFGERLSARLSCPRLAIDDFGNAGTDRWPSLVGAVEGVDGLVVVESCSMPLAYRRLVSYSILLQIPDQVRLRHLRERGESSSEAERLLRDRSRTATAADLVLESVDAASISRVEQILRSVNDGHRLADSPCNGDGHQGVDPFSVQTDTGSHGPFDRYRVGPRGIA